MSKGRPWHISLFGGEIVKWKPTTRGRIDADQTADLVENQRHCEKLMRGDRGFAPDETQSGLNRLHKRSAIARARSAAFTAAFPEFFRAARAWQPSPRAPGQPSRRDRSPAVSPCRP